jgi:hypothetical protein
MTNELVSDTQVSFCVDGGKKFLRARWRACVIAEVAARGLLNTVRLFTRTQTAASNGGALPGPERKRDAPVLDLDPRPTGSIGPVAMRPSLGGTFLCEARNIR